MPPRKFQLVISNFMFIQSEIFECSLHHFNIHQGALEKLNTKDIGDCRQESFVFYS